MNRLKLKTGSTAWMNFFGIPHALIVLGVLMLVKKCFSAGWQMHFVWPVLVLGTGILLYVLQLNKLKFKAFPLSVELENFKKEVREMLRKDGWEIDHDSKQSMTATYRGGTFSLERVTLRFYRGRVEWNVIHHPEDHNAFAAVFAPNKRGKRLIDRMGDCYRRRGLEVV